MKKTYLLIFVLFLSSSLSFCSSAEKKTTPAQDYADENLKTAYFASGCFWCVEAVFQSVKGVKDAISGYSGGKKASPTYREVSSGQLMHAEAVKVIYDPNVVDFETLVLVFFDSHDPTTPNQQGPDRGPQYRSIAFYETPEEEKIIRDFIAKREQEQYYAKPIVTEVKAFDKFWEAEEYHQEYERLHPENPYVQNVSIPRLRKFQALHPELLKSSH